MWVSDRWKTYEKIWFIVLFFYEHSKIKRCLSIIINISPSITYSKDKNILLECTFMLMQCTSVTDDQYVWSHKTGSAHVFSRYFAKHTSSIL